MCVTMHGVLRVLCATYTRAGVERENRYLKDVSVCRVYVQVLSVCEGRSGVKKRMEGRDRDGC